MNTRALVAFDIVDWDETFYDVATNGVGQTPNTFFRTG